jgi:Pectate lyase superfamily protein
MQRRALFRIGGMALASGALLPSSATAIADQVPPYTGVVSVKDPQFGARGDSQADDTKAIQAAVDYCYGSSSDPHGTEKVNTNRVLHLPPGNYRITSPIRFAKLHGARIIGSGRFVTKIVNGAGGSVFATNGCGYSHFEGMYLQASDRSSPVLDLNWDGTPGGPALQSNSFFDMFFDGGATGVDIGAGGYMGSENIFINCFWIYSAIAGLKTSNFNALQNTLVGGNLQACNIGIWVWRGSVCVIESVGFQLSKQWDVRVDNSANDTINVIGCRTESSNFVQVENFVHTYILGCSQTEAGPPGYFLRPGGCPTTVERCVSINGQISLSGDARLTVRGSSFGRKDWLDYSPLNADQSIEIEDVQYGGTPNSKSRYSASRIAKQRITSAGVHNYTTVAA